MNKAMFTGDDRPQTEADLEGYADAAVGAFLVGYGVEARAGRHSSRRTSRPMR